MVLTNGVSVALAEDASVEGGLAVSGLGGGADGQYDQQNQHERSNQLDAGHF